jgi:hypothetical protein
MNAQNHSPTRKNATAQQARRSPAYEETVAAHVQTRPPSVAPERGVVMSSGPPTLARISGNGPLGLVVVTLAVTRFCCHF